MVFQYIVVFILNSVGLEELLKYPAAESTRLRVNVDVHGTLQSSLSNSY